MELLREKKRQYIADKTKAIGIGQQAQIAKDVSQVAGAVSSIAGNISVLESNLQKKADEQAKKDFEAHEKEAQAIVEDARAQYGENITSDEAQQAIRSRLGEHARKYRPAYDSDRMGAAYDRLADEYTEQAIDANYLYSTRAKIARQNAERKEAERVAKQQSVNVGAYNQVGEEFIAQVGNLGKHGAHKDVSELTSSVNENIDKMLAKVPATNIQRLEAKSALYNGAMQSQAVGALTSDDPMVAKQMDLALNNQEVFDRTFSDDLIMPQIEYAKANVLQGLENQRTTLESDLMTSTGNRQKEIQKKLDKLNKQISAFEEKDELEGQNFTDAMREQIRLGIRNATKDRAKHALGEQELASRLEVFEQQKQFMSDGIIDPYNPMIQQTLDFMAKTKDKWIPGFERIGWVAQKLKDSMGEGTLSSYKPEQWQEMADSYRSYKEHMSKVSPFTESFYTTKADVNAGLFELMESRPTDDKGDPTEFEMKALKFLDKMASADLTEEERLSYRDYVAGLLTSDNATVQKQRELLRSGDVGVYAKGGGLGIINYPASDLPVTDTRQGGGISGTRRLYDERAQRGIKPESVEYGRAYYANRDFDIYLRRASAEYVTQAVNMLRNGASEQDVLLMKAKKINDAVSNYYHDYHVVDLAALDAKLEKHQPAFQNIDGIVYEYKGRDSLGLPLWYDHGVLNTNRDFHQLFEPKRMAGAPTQEPVSKIKRSEIGADMEAKNE